MGTIPKSVKEAQKRKDRLDAIGIIRRFVSKGDTLYTVLRHVSQSGMARDISVYAIKDNKPRLLDGLICDILKMSKNPKGDGVRITGCDMDMGYKIVYSLSRALHEENAGRGDGGYTLRHRWL